MSEELFVDQLQRLRTGQVDVVVGGIPEALASGEFVSEALIDTTMVAVVRKGSPLARARHLSELAQARWVYTSAATDTGYAARLFERHGLPPPPMGAVVNSTLALLSLVGSGDLVGLMPQQIAQHPLAAPYITTVPLAEAGLPLTVGAIIRSDSVVSPAIRHFAKSRPRACSLCAIASRGVIPIPPASSSVWSASSTSGKWLRGPLMVRVSPGSTPS